ncbi:ribose 5-phosphate isomerase A [Candidatus Similichlamydia epinepheli]|uniref:ribose 5-phosphate isomerase A n=1 Tax=Candidatus Similichlamydia epinepheli TaxID=1903953 RepID=UPI000D3B04FF|nr:ribose 5-phosphate isomerase A [Candidatus Similichlamydia epinepheli]
MGIYDLKAILAKKAIECLPREGVLGLGTGTTTEAFIEALGAHLRTTEQSYQVTASSYASEQLAIRLGLDVLKKDIPNQLAMTIDGADCISEAEGVLLKGMGGALLREKILKQAAASYLVLVTEEKWNLSFPISISLEILPFGFQFVEHNTASIGKCNLRKNEAGSPITSDNGNWLADLFLQEKPNWKTLHHKLKLIPGILETGIFLLNPSQPTHVLTIDSKCKINKKTFH